MSVVRWGTAPTQGGQQAVVVPLDFAAGAAGVIDLRLVAGRRRYAWRGWTDASGGSLVPRRAFAVAPGTRLYRFDGPRGLRGGAVTVEAVLAGRRGWHALASVELAQVD